MEKIQELTEYEELKIFVYTYRKHIDRKELANICGVSASLVDLCLTVKKGEEGVFYRDNKKVYLEGKNMIVRARKAYSKGVK